MLEKRLDSVKLMIEGIIVMCTGLFVLYKQRLLIYWLGILFIFISFLLFLKYHQWIYSIIVFSIGVIHCVIPNIPLFLVQLSISFVFMMHAFIHFITFLLHYRNKSLDFIQEIFFTLCYLLFAFLVYRDSSSVMLIIGIYFILYGLCDLKDALFAYYHIQIKSFIRHKVRIELPIVLSVLIPSKVLKTINGLSYDEVIKENKSDQKPDIEVLIHMTPSGYSALGHVDLCINGYVITYGNYDASSYRLFDAIGDGVLMVVKKEEYIEFCKRDTNKTLVGFGLMISDEKKIAIKKRIRTIFDLLYPWECDYKKAMKTNDIDKMNKSLTYYANRIYKATGAKMYKFKKSKFKTYFVFTTNCVLLADSILEKAGVDLLGINGIITPGTYYDYLNREFQKETLFVVSRRVYQ